MKKIYILLNVTILLAFACNDSESPTDTIQKKYSLVGEWHEVGSTESLGKIVVFTDTTITAWYYANNYESGGTVYNYDEKWFDQKKYLLKDDTLTILNFNVVGFPYYPFKTPLIFHSNDTLEISYFIPNDNDAGFPFNINGTILYRRCNYEN